MGRVWFTARPMVCRPQQVAGQMMTWNCHSAETVWLDARMNPGRLAGCGRSPTNASKTRVPGES